jgi:hypothetical protein
MIITGGDLSVARWVVTWQDIVLRNAKEEKGPRLTDI